MPAPRLGTPLRLCEYIFISSCFFALSSPTVAPVDGGQLPARQLWASVSAGEIADGEPELTLIVYNLENLFDIDGIALFEDYSPERYQAAHLRIKLRNIVRVLQQIPGGKGPDILLAQELEADQTPSDPAFDDAQFLRQWAETSLDEMLQEPVSEAVRDLPAAAFLLKALQEAGFGDYHVAVGEYRPDPTGRVVAHVNATFSKYPIGSQQTHPSPCARGVLEVQHDVAGFPLITFNNHWKSGASDPDSELIRRGNATTLRRRLDEILQLDPQADIVIGGDFNSQYNQLQAYPTLAPTALQSILQSQGDELAIQSPDSPALYNLWYELPPDQRGSDVFRDQWGTLMQVMLARGLYDNIGLQYVDNSFEVLIYENLNAQAGSRLPIRWAQVDGVGGGFSDHFPLQLRLRVVGQKAALSYPPLQNPSTAETGELLRPVDYAAAKLGEVRSLNELGSDAAICNPENLGHVFQVQAVVSGERPFRVRVFEQDYNLWAFNVDLRRDIYSRFVVGQSINIYAEVGIHQQNWQLIIRDPSWLEH